jgi:hypothetical protein
LRNEPKMSHVAISKRTRNEAALSWCDCGECQCIDSASCRCCGCASRLAESAAEDEREFAEALEYDGGYELDLFRREEARQ